MPQELTIIFERGDGWWIATIPEVPGAFSQGRTKDEARENVVDASSELMAARRELSVEGQQARWTALEQGAAAYYAETI